MGDTGSLRQRGPSVAASWASSAASAAGLAALPGTILVRTSPRRSPAQKCSNAATTCFMASLHRLQPLCWKHRSCGRVNCRWTPPRTSDAQRSVPRAARSSRPTTERAATPAQALQCWTSAKHRSTAGLVSGGQVRQLRRRQRDSRPESVQIRRHLNMHSRRGDACLARRPALVWFNVGPREAGCPGRSTALSLDGVTKSSSESAARMLLLQYHYTGSMRG
jgi:hypothetical protein